jgi:hypothetical protein
LAGRVPLKIIYLVVRLVAALAVLVFRRDLAKEAELRRSRRAARERTLMPSAGCRPSRLSAPTGC